MIKLLLISPVPPPAGGMASWTAEYLSALQNSEIECRLVNTALYGDRAVKSRSVGSEMVRFFRVFREYSAERRRFRPDICHFCVSCSLPGLVSTLIIMRKNQNNILHCHCNVEDWIKKSSLAGRLFRAVCRRCRLVFVLNEQSLCYVRGATGIDCRIIPNFIRRENIVADKVISDTLRKLIYVGHITYAKGYREILKVAAKYPDLIFTLAGECGAGIDTSELPPNVVLTGILEHEKLIGQLDRSDLFIFPSYSEGFSMALLEAAARGLPSVASDVGANRDIVGEDGGIIITAGDSAMLAEAIEKVRDADVRKKMSRACLERVHAYETEKVCRRIAAVYSEVLA